MTSNRRSFPRISVEELGLLEFAPPTGQVRAGGRRPRRVTVLVSSVAQEGLRLTRPDPVDELRPGCRVDLRMFVEDQQLSLPGEVAWLVTATHGETNIGVSLALELTASATQRVWESWIDRKTRRQQRKRRAAL